MVYLALICLLISFLCHIFFSVPHPFKGDYLNLQQNLKWKKLCEQTHDKYMVFADIVMKINRANGKVWYHFVYDHIITEDITRWGFFFVIY